MSIREKLTRGLQNGADPHFYDNADWAEMIEGDGPLTRPFGFTVFPDTKARRADLRKGSLIDLARTVETTSAPRKSDLPLLSLGRYGKMATEKLSLRHKANRKRVYGVEGDYDTGDMPPEVAARLLAEAGIAALIYTTPSHGQPEKGNRWRVIAPLEKSCEPGERGRYLARVDAALGHVFAHESYHASQSFYFGGEDGGAPVETYLVPGDYVDRREDLDDRAIDLSPIVRDTPPEPAVDQSDMPEAIEAAQAALASAIEKVRTAEIGGRTHTLHRQAHRLGGYIACATLDRDDVQAALFEAAQDNGYSEDYGDAEIERHVSNGIASGEARPTPWSEKAIEFEDVDDDDDGDAPDLAGLTFDAPDAWAARPPRDYVLKGLIAPGQHGCIFGEPGAGKSVIAPRLAYAVAQGEPFFGMKTKAGPVFYVACEDEEGMGARIEALRQDHGDAPDLRLVRGCSDLFSPGAVEGRGSPQFEALRREAKRVRPSLIIIDTLAMSAPGLEENAAEGMGRINAISSALAKFGAAVIWIHHGTKAEGNTPRGHSSFNGRLDFSLLVRKADQAGIVRASLPKNRLGPSDRQFAYRIDSRVVGTDVDGDDVTAPICQPVDAPAEVDRPLKPTERHTLDLLAEKGGEVDAEAFRAEAAEDARISAAEKRDDRRRVVSAALQGLVRRGQISISGGIIRLDLGGPSPDDFEDCDDAD